MREVRLYCDACGVELTDGYPGETYTAVPVREAVERHHDPSEENTEYYHLCSDEVEPFDPQSSQLFRAGDTVPMMLLAKYGYEYAAREEFPEPWGVCAEVLERVWPE